MTSVPTRRAALLRRTVTIGLCVVGFGLTAPAALAEVRTIDGTGNNPGDFALGSADTPLLRQTTVSYDDGRSAPRTQAAGGGNLPSPRAISNAVNTQTGLGSIPNERNLSSFIWQWGQFMDHDIDLTGAGAPLEPFNIPIPAGDPFFDPHGTGTQSMFLNRSVFEPGSHPREQTNQVTHWIDGSNVYGSDDARAAALREFSGGRLLTTTTPVGELLPFNTAGVPNDRGPGGLIPVGQDFLAGDVRANEQLGLTAMHTLFVREHNRIAAGIAASDPSLDDETIYQQAHRIVGAEIQAITYNEWLPTLLGPDVIDPYTGYDPTVDPRIDNVFSTAAFRFGHTMLVPELLRLDEHGTPIAAGNIALHDAFFNPDEILTNGGIEPLLQGLAFQPAQEVDPRIVDEVRNFLFGPPGAGGFDLASLNIQRGRDHGLAGYNQVRVDFGLLPAANFADLTSDPDLQAALASVYAAPDDVDAWVGMLVEDHLAGGSLGELATLIIEDQFERLRAGDRFWYQNDPFFLNNPDLLLEIENTTLTVVIKHNTLYGHFPENAFFVESLPAQVPVPGSLPALLLGLAVFYAGEWRRRWPVTSSRSW